MIIGTGVDIVKISRIERMTARWGNHFLEKIFTEGEIDYCRHKPNQSQHFAVRFAAKEALYKMLDGSRKQLQWHELEIINTEQGNPQVKLQGKAKSLSESKGIKKIHISLSHEREYAVAQVIGE